MIKFATLLSVIFLFYSNTLFANITNKIVKKLSNTDNIYFNFEQITNKQIETGNCLIVFPGKLKCKYDGNENKEILIKKNSLYIIKHKFKRSYRYSTKKSVFNIILDKSKLLENIKLTDKSKIYETENQYSYELNSTNGNFIKIFFNKTDKKLKGWETISYNQEIVIFNILDSKTNIKFDENFALPNYKF